MTFRLARQVTLAGFVDEANPNVSQPSANQVFTMTGAAVEGDGPVEGHWVYLRFIDNSNAEIVGPTISFRTWVKDQGATSTLARGAWAALVAESGATSGQLYNSVLRGDVFVQLTTLASVGSATKVQIWIEESSAVDG